MNATILDPIEKAASAHFGGSGEGSFAPYFLGMIVDNLLLGVVFNQVFVWWQYSSKIDRGLVKGLVYYLLFISISMSAYVVSYQLHLFAFHFGVYATFLDRQWSSVFYIMTIMSRIPTSLFFTERAWRISGRSYILLAVLLSLTACGFAGALASKIISTGSKPTSLLQTTILLWQGSELVADTIITIVITVCLFRSKNGWSATDEMIGRLLILTAETQLPPTIMTIAFVITLVHAGGTTAVYFFTCSPKVHVICLLAVLNGRVKLRDTMRSDRSGGDVDLTRLDEVQDKGERGMDDDDIYKRKSGSRYRVGKGGGLGVVSVGVHTETVTQVIHDDTFIPTTGLSVNGRPLRIGARPSRPPLPIGRGTDETHDEDFSDKNKADGLSVKEEEDEEWNSGSPTSPEGGMGGEEGMGS